MFMSNVYKEAKMTTKKQLRGIHELNISRKLTQMNDHEFDDYVQVLNTFVEEFPAQEVNIKNALDERDYSSLSKNLVVIKDMLIQIHADALAEDCLKQISGFNIKHEKTEAFITSFLSALTMLSIDIQMATIKDEDAEEDQQPAKNTDDPTMEKKSILAVDDSAFFLGLLKNVLQDTEYKLTCVTSGRAALKFLQNRRPSLFILDIEMPHLDGYDLAVKIKECGHTAPIIFLTANATRKYVIDAVNAGAVDFIVKAPRKEDVLERIAKYI
jgi:CheY-like chemotaxis protein